MSRFPIHLFSEDYPTARRRFLAAASLSGGIVKNYVDDGLGPEGEEVACDCAWFGPADADRVLILLSGTHGVEGFAGAGPQLDWIANGGPEALPPDMAALVVHGINAWGYAWKRRETEEGVDLNRNFIDFSQPLPGNPGYDAIADLLVPPSIAPDDLDRAEAGLRAYRAKHGDAAYLTARGAGQYRHRHGLFYGGTAPCRARLTSEALIAEYGLAKRTAVAVVDYHTGLGPHGYGEPISFHDAGTPAATRIRSWYGQSLTEPKRGTSITVPLRGMSNEGWQSLIGDKLTFLTLEFGTLPPEGMQRALAQDHWLHAQGPISWTDPEVRRIKTAMMDAYLPKGRDWREAVLFRCRQIVDQTIDGLAAQAL